MKFSHRFITLTAVYLSFCIAFVLAQDKSPKKDDKVVAPPVEIKANLLVLDAAGKLAGDIKLEDVKIFEDGVEQKIKRFAVKDRTLNLGLVVDNTGSLRQDLGAVLLSAASFGVEELQENDRAFIIRFVGRNNAEMPQDWTSDKSKLIQAIEGMYIEGGLSAVVDALYLSAEHIARKAKENPSERFALLLISDAEDRDSFYKIEQALAHLKNTDVQIFVIGLTRGAKDAKKAQKSANQISFETGGAAYFWQSGREQLLDYLKTVMIEARSPYLIEYVSTNQDRNGKSRKLKIQIADGAKGEKRQAFVRESIVVPEK